MVDGPNLYVYCNNDPINYVDLWGLNQDKADSWWEKLEKGEYYGTGFGTKATEAYGQLYIKTGNVLWIIPGTISALWMPDTYQTTGWILITGYEAGAYLGRPYYQYYPKGNEGYNSPYLTRGRGWKAPYKAGEEAAEKLSLPQHNPGTAVRRVTPNPLRYIKGPEKIIKKFGRSGGGTQYILE